MNKQAAIPSPIGRGGATITYCRDTNKVYLLGGQTEEANALVCQRSTYLIYQQNLGPRFKQKEVPSPREWSYSCSERDLLYLFGGMARTQDHCLNDLYVLQVSNEACYIWSKILDKPQLNTNGINIRPPAPCPRNGHTATLVQEEVIPNEMNTIDSTVASVTIALVYIFGGGSPATGPLNDMHILDVTYPEDVHWRPLSSPFVDVSSADTNTVPPLPREMHSAVFFPTPRASSAQRVSGDTETTRNAQAEGRKHE